MLRIETRNKEYSFKILRKVILDLLGYFGT
jgi:hypothetical protein